MYEVESAPGEAALNEIRAELKSQGYLKYYKQRDRKQKPADFLRYMSGDGFEILVGRNNLQNDKLTLHTARGKDLWFHVQKAPGSHCVVMSRERTSPIRPSRRPPSWPCCTPARTAAPRWPWTPPR